MHRNTIFVEKPAVAAYTGPGDIMPGAVFWTGLRGYNGAYATGSNPAVDIVDQAGNNPATINILNDGTLDTATINAWVAAHGVTKILISRLYDQSGNGNHFTQATSANRPTLALNSIGSNNRPSIQRGPNSTLNVFTAQALTQAQPFFISAVCRQDTSTGAWADVLSAGGYLQIGFANTSDNVFMYLASAPPIASAVHGIPHAVQWTFNGAASEMYVDGTGTAASPGVSGIQASPLAIPGDQNGGESVVIGEEGMWSGTAAPAQKSNMNSNQHTWYGF